MMIMFTLLVVFLDNNQRFYHHARDLIYRQKNGRTLVLSRLKELNLMFSLTMVVFMFLVAFLQTRKFGTLQHKNTIQSPTNGRN